MSTFIQRDETYLENQFPLWHRAISFEPLPFLAAVWSRLAEVGVRVTVIAISFIAVLLFEELDEQIETMTEISPSRPSDTKYNEEMSQRLRKWRCHYDLVSQFVEQINQCFGPVLLIATAVDFCTAIYQFHDILQYMDLCGTIVSRTFYDQKYRTMENPIDLIAFNGYTPKVVYAEMCFFQCFNVFLRFSALLLASNGVASKVRIILLIYRFAVYCCMTTSLRSLVAYGDIFYIS